MHIVLKCISQPLVCTNVTTALLRADVTRFELRDRTSWHREYDQFYNAHGWPVTLGAEQVCSPCQNIYLVRHPDIHLRCKQQSTHHRTRGLQHNFRGSTSSPPGSGRRDCNRRRTLCCGMETLIADVNAHTYTYDVDFVSEIVCKYIGQCTRLGRWATSTHLKVQELSI